MQMSEWGKPVVHCAQTAMDIPYLLERNERDYVLMLDNLRRDLDEGRELRLSMLVYVLLSAPYDLTPSLFWSKA